MSVNNRKIGYYSIVLNKKSENYFDSGFFLDFIKFINDLPNDAKIRNDKNTNKALLLSSASVNKINGATFSRIILNNCTYNHVADYMSHIDGAVRPSSKKLHEGEQELTHLCIKISEKEGLALLEQRRLGFTFSAIYNYLNLFLKKYLQSLNMSDIITIMLFPITSDSSLEAIESTERILSAEMYVENKVLGSGYLELMNPKNTYQDNIIITAKAERKQSLEKSDAAGLIKRIKSKTDDSYQITRIRLHCKGCEEKDDILIDTLKWKKTEKINVELTENGIVDSESIFLKGLY